MNRRSALSTSPVDINFADRQQPIAAMLTFIPVIAAMLITMALLVEDLSPVFLSGLLLVGLICCLLVSWFALQVLCDGLLRFEPETHVVSRVFSLGADGWPDIEPGKAVTTRERSADIT
jgi:hypothetical protein